MNIEDILYARSGRQPRVERRVRFNADQVEQLDDIETKLGVPFAALVRMAVDQFLPRTRNQNFTEQGIKRAYFENHAIPKKP